MILAILLSFAAAADTGDGSTTVPVDCAKPTLTKQSSISAQEMNGLMARAQAYVTCMSKAIEAQRKLADDTLEKAKVAAGKSNAMVQDVNAFIADVKAFQEDHSGN